MSGFTAVFRAPRQPVRIRMGTCFSIAGIAFTALVMSGLLPQSVSPDSPGTALTTGGWIALAGGLMQRHDAGLWPFNTPAGDFAVRWIARPLLMILWSLLVLLAVCLFIVVIVVGVATFGPRLTGHG